MPKDIFVSHSSADEPLARKLVDILLEGGCGVTANRILCTSMEGLTIPAGASSFIDFLLDEIEEPKLVILLLSDNYFASTFCLCELGATWGLRMQTFPLVVAPMKKSTLRGTLAVTQAGDVVDPSYLDELKDVVAKRLKVNPPTARWNVKREEFLKSAGKIIKKLPKPPTVTRKELEEANKNFAAAMEDVEAKSTEIERLNEMIEELKKLKDKPGVERVKAQFSESNDEELFDEVCAEARKALGKLQGATVEALFHQVREEFYRPDRDEWDDVRRALKLDEIVDNGDGTFSPGSRKSVATADAAIEKLESLIRDLNFGESAFAAYFEDERGYPLRVGNQDFWNTLTA